MPAIDVLVVGCGNIAGGFDLRRSPNELPLTHAGAYSRHPGFRIAACVDPDAGRRDAFMARWRVPSGFSSMAEASSAHFPRPGVVSICSPTASHASNLESALALGPRAIFCEKPVTPIAAETLRWVGACEASGVLLAVNYTRRWAPDVVRLKAQLVANSWGELRSIAGVYNKGILNNGSHLVDLITYLAGPLKLVAAGPAVHDFWPDDPTIAALLTTDAAVPVTLSPAHAADYAVFELELITSRGILTMENGGMSWRVRRPADSPHYESYRTLAPAADSDGEYAAAMSEAVSNLHDALVHGTPLASNGHTALQAQRICEQIRTSAAHTRTAT